MPITVRYDPSYVTGGQLAHDAGQGQFLQKQAQFDYQRMDTDRKFGLAEDQLGEQSRQFDESLAQGGSQFDRNLGFQQDSARLQDSQFGRNLTQNAYEASQNRSQRGYEFGAQLQQRQAEVAGQGRAREEAFRQRERSDLRGIQQQKEQQRFGLGLQAAQNLQAAIQKGDLTVQQAEQAKGQWVQQYGSDAGFSQEFPFDVPSPGTPEFDNDSFRQSFTDMGTDGDGEVMIAPSEMGMYTETIDGKTDWRKDANGNPKGLDDFIKQRTFLSTQKFNKALNERQFEIAQNNRIETEKKAAMALGEKRVYTKAEKEEIDGQKRIMDAAKRRFDFELKVKTVDVETMKLPRADGTQTLMTPAEKEAYIHRQMTAYDQLEIKPEASGVGGTQPTSPARGSQTPGPPLAEYTQEQIANMPRVTTAEEYAALSSGTPFVADDGKIRVKP